MLGKFVRTGCKKKMKNPLPAIHDNTTKDKSYKTILKDTFLQYSQTTSLHGLKFIGNTNISDAERLFFLFAFIGSVVISSYHISIIYFKWHSVPILITMNSIATPITSIPFPAITICNLNQAKRSRVKYIKPGMEGYGNLQTLCKNQQKMHLDNFTESDDWNQMRKFILEVSQPCEEMLLECSYGSTFQACMSTFEPVLTDVGVCCTFNQVHPDFLFTKHSRNNAIVVGSFEKINKPVKWNPEAGYEENLPKLYYPRKALGTGLSMGLSVVLNASVNEYYCSSTRGVGFKMLLHNPTEIPKFTHHGYLLTAGQETQITIRPRLHNSASNLRRIRQKTRHCIYSDEVQLRFYQIYTKSNCELECEADRLHQECGCVTYYLPRASNDTAVCGLKDFQCIQKVQFESESLLNESTSCGRCLPGCTSLTYIPELSSAELVTSNSLFKANVTIFKGTNIKELAVLHFFFDQSSFRASTKEEFSGFAEFLASSGGILGLFLGFSILSVIELLYFLFLALYAVITNYTERKKHVFHRNANSKNISSSASFWRGFFKSSTLTKSDTSNHRSFHTYYAQPRTLYKAKISKRKIEEVPTVL